MLASSMLGFFEYAAVAALPRNDKRLRPRNEGKSPARIDENIVITNDSEARREGLEGVFGRAGPRARRTVAYVEPGGGSHGHV